MDERTRAYLRGRFRDYYRRLEVTPPPAAERREWGYIPFSPGGTTMIRHRSLFDLGDLGDFLRRERPRHVYFSAGRYRDPGAGTMGEKGWQGSDLIFDLDADHLPGVDPEADSYREMLAACKEALHRLLDVLTDDLGFDDPAIVFSGGRGYHVHVRAPSVRQLDRESRREVVDYIRGIDVAFETLVETEAVAGMGLKNPTQKRTLSTAGGWSRRAHRRLVTLVEELVALPEEDAIERLEGYEGIGPGKAASALTAARSNLDEIRSGNIDVHPAFYSLARAVFDETVAAESAAIDEPVTTDIHRLIRLPGSLHGGTALRVMPLTRDELAGFDPLVDAVPEVFTGHEIRVHVDDGPPVELGGETFTVPAGVTTLPEYVALFLMAGGRAQKEKEA
jgi:DNA primase small subunit